MPYRRAAGPAGARMRLGAGAAGAKSGGARDDGGRAARLGGDGLRRRRSGGEVQRGVGARRRGGAAGSEAVHTAERDWLGAWVGRRVGGV